MVFAFQSSGAAHVELLSFTIPGYALARVMGAATAVLRDQYSSADPNT